MSPEVGHVVAFAARSILAAAFVVAGSAKLADRDGVRRSALEFGLPAGLAGATATLLPLSELGLAALLGTGYLVRWSAIAALAMLTAFTALMAANLVRGRAPECNCFGQLHSEPIGPRTLVRNAILMSTAGLVAARAATARPTPILAIGLVALVVISRALARRARTGGDRTAVSHLTERPAPASRAPATNLTASDFAVPDLSGSLVTLSSLLADAKPVLLVFADPSCGPCKSLYPDIARWQRENAESLSIAIVSRGSRRANEAAARSHGLRRVLLQTDREVAAAYHATGTPAAVLIGPDGMLEGHLATGTDAIRALVRRCVGPAAGAAPQTATGRVVPDLTLRTPAGERVRLADLPRPAVVLFWNPACPHCRTLLPGLKAVEAFRKRGTPPLIVVSSGTESERPFVPFSTVLIDTDAMAIRSFGMSGTPSAVRIEESGVISHVASGSRDVLAFVRRHVPANLLVSRRRSLQLIAASAAAVTIGRLGPWGARRARASNKLCGTEQDQARCRDVANRAWRTASKLCQTADPRAIGSCYSAAERIRSNSYDACLSQSCAPGEVCSNGTCCGAGLQGCNGSCCDASCQQCEGGACVDLCQPNEVCVCGMFGCECQCDSEKFCGYSGSLCCGVCERCDGSQCVPICDEGACCNDQCVDPLTDNQNCGYCGHACPPGSTCKDGSCECEATCTRDCCDGECCPEGTCCCCGVCIPSTDECCSYEPRARFRC